MKSKPLRHVFTQATYRVILVSAIILCVLSSVLMAAISRRNLYNSLLELSERKSESVDRILDTVSETMRNIAYDEGLQTLLAQYAAQDSTDELLARIRINRQLQNQSRFFSQADNIIVYSPEGVTIGNKYAVDSQVVQHIQSLLQVVQDHGNILWLLEPGQSLQSDGVTCILITEIRASQSYAGAKLNDLLGYLVVQYNFGDIQRTLETEQEGYDAHLVNISGQILSTSSPERMEGRSPLTMPLKLDEVFTLTLRGELYYAAAQKIELPAVSLYCVCTAPMLKILEDVLVAILSILIFSVMLMICTYFVIRRRARRICGAFEEMNRSFGLIEEGKLTVDAIPPTGVEEVDHLTARFSHMADRLEQVMYELYESELHKQSLIADRREAELMAVRMQINPHFLYNTLDTINWTALTNGDNEVSEMVLMMGRLLRSNLSLSSVKTTVAMELQRVELFVQLEQKRFGAGLCYETQADEAILDAMMPGMILQLLVENAINHGLSSGRGLVRVEVREVNRQIVATVTDNGRGMDEATARELRQVWELLQKDPVHAMEPSTHIGLRNIMKRLRLLYGNQAGFSFETSVNGTTIRISYPKQF